MRKNLVNIEILGIAEAFHPDLEAPLSVFELFSIADYESFGLSMNIGSTEDATYIGSISEQAIINYATKLEERLGFESFTFIVRVIFPRKQQCYTWPQLSVAEII